MVEFLDALVPTEAAFGASEIEGIDPVRDVIVDEIYVFDQFGLSEGLDHRRAFPEVGAVFVLLPFDEVMLSLHGVEVGVEEGVVGDSPKGAGVLAAEPDFGRALFDGLAEHGEGGSVLSGEGAFSWVGRS